MYYDGILDGRYVYVRSAKLSDAEYTLSIRQDKKKTKFLHIVDNDIGKQMKWLEAQIRREGDYLFVVSDKDGNNIGTVGLYEIKNNRGHLGRLLMTGNPVMSFEACILVCRFGFDTLGINEIWGDVDEGNTPSLNFSKALGFKFKAPVKEGERIICYGKVFKEEFPKYQRQLEEMIYR